MRKVPEFGKALKRLRIDVDETGQDMAEKLGVTPAFFSKMEHGRTAAPKHIVDRIIGLYGLPEDAAESLRDTAHTSRKRFTFEPASPLARKAAGMMADQINDLSDDDLNNVIDILKKGAGAL